MCVRISVCVCARACVWVCGEVPGRVGVFMSMHACSVAYPTFKAHAPYCDVICGLSGTTTFFDIIS